jgi:polyhydroxyalkanoate synthesis regulator protein
MKHNSERWKAMATLMRPSAIEQAMKSISSQQSRMEKVIAGLARSTFTETAVQSAASYQSEMSKAMAALAGPSAIEQAIRVFTKSHRILVTDPRFLSGMAESIAGIDFGKNISVVNQAEYEDKFSEASNELSDASDNRSFIKIFDKMSPIFQLFLFCNGPHT